MKALIPP